MRNYRCLSLGALFVLNWFNYRISNVHMYLPSMIIALGRSFRIPFASCGSPHIAFAWPTVAFAPCFLCLDDSTLLPLGDYCLGPELCFIFQILFDYDFQTYVCLWMTPRCSHSPIIAWSPELSIRSAVFAQSYVAFALLTVGVILVCFVSDVSSLMSCPCFPSIIIALAQSFGFDIRACLARYPFVFLPLTAPLCVPSLPTMILGKLP